MYYKTINILLFLVTIISYQSIYCQDDEDNKTNDIKISLFSFFNNSKIQYEHSKLRHSYGITASYFYLNPVTGLKAEPYYRNYFKSNAPLGYFIEVSLGCGAFNTYETFHRTQYTYDSEMNLVNETVIDGNINKRLFVYSYGGSLRFGYQDLFGILKRITAEISIGLQYFIYNIDTDKEEKIFKDLYGNTIIFETSYGNANGYSSENYLYWYIFGPGSVFSPQVKFGYLF
ncbi:MAG: hypothetical protein Kow0068_09050 [Marinilabiliales bacterium]